MNKNDVERINRQLKALIGLQGISIGRGEPAAKAWIAWINFGHGDSGYALHLQCAFRVREKDNILVTNVDMFRPSASALEKQIFDYDTFDWSKQGENRYDEWVENVSQDFLNSLKVVDAKVTHHGDVTILFMQDIIIDVFIDVTVDECWRLLKRDSDYQLVMSGNGLE